LDTTSLAAWLAGCSAPPPATDTGTVEATAADEPTRNGTRTVVTD
jgi:hypothetical protein